MIFVAALGFPPSHADGPLRTQKRELEVMSSIIGVTFALGNKAIVPMHVYSSLKPGLEGIAEEGRPGLGTEMS